MKQKHIFIYFINSFLLLFSALSFSQNDSIPSTENDSLKTKLKYGIRLGGDLSKLARSFADDDYTGFEVLGDYRISNNLYVAGELGFEEKNTVNTYLNVTTTGSYIKAGVDFNLYENWLDMDNMIFSGFRIGASTYSQNLNEYTIYTTNIFWEPQFTSRELQEFNDLSAFWFEFMLGAKAELFNNLYLGLNVQLKILLNDSDIDNFESLYIPGYNKTNDSNRIGVGYGYTLSYRIPLYKKDKVSKKEKE